MILIDADFWISQLLLKYGLYKHFGKKYKPDIRFDARP